MRTRRGRCTSGCSCSSPCRRCAVLSSVAKGRGVPVTSLWRLATTNGEQESLDHATATALVADEVYELSQTTVDETSFAQLEASALAALVHGSGVRLECVLPALLEQAREVGGRAVVVEICDKDDCWHTIALAHASHCARLLCSVACSVARGVGRRRGGGGSA